MNNQKNTRKTKINKRGRLDRSQSTLQTYFNPNPHQSTCFGDCCKRSENQRSGSPESPEPHNNRRERSRRSSTSRLPQSPIPNPRVTFNEIRYGMFIPEFSPEIKEEENEASNSIPDLRCEEELDFSYIVEDNKKPSPINSYKDLDLGLNEVDHDFLLRQPLLQYDHRSETRRMRGRSRDDMSYVPPSNNLGDLNVNEHSNIEMPMNNFNFVNNYMSDGESRYHNSHIDESELRSVLSNINEQHLMNEVTHMSQGESVFGLLVDNSAVDVNETQFVVPRASLVQLIRNQTVNRLHTFRFNMYQRKPIMNNLMRSTFTSLYNMQDNFNVTVHWLGQNAVFINDLLLSRGYLNHEEVEEGLSGMRASNNRGYNEAKSMVEGFENVDIMGTDGNLIDEHEEEEDDEYAFPRYMFGGRLWWSDELIKLFLMRKQQAVNEDNLALRGNLFYNERFFMEWDHLHLRGHSTGPYDSIREFGRDKWADTIQKSFVVHIKRGYLKEEEHVEEFKKLRRFI